MENIELFATEDFVLEVQTIGLVEPVSFITIGDGDEAPATIRTITSSRII